MTIKDFTKLSVAITLHGSDRYTFRDEPSVMRGVITDHMEYVRYILEYGSKAVVAEEVKQNV